MKLAEKIIGVYNKNGEILNGNYEIKYFKSKYSSFSGESLNLFIDGKPISRVGVKVKFECFTCSSENEILLEKYLKKEEESGCKKCRERCAKKRNLQSKFVRESFEKNGKVLPKSKDKKIEKSNIQLIEDSKFYFSLESEDFQSRYFEINTTISEYEKHLKNIIRINGLSVKNVDFIPFLKIDKHTKYSQYVYDHKNDKLLRFKNIEYLCQSCEKEFLSSTTRLPKMKFNNNKILCKDCGFCNKTFKIKTTKNILDENIKYQSKLELELIDFCEENKIIIKNGPKLNYKFKGRDLKYYVDFEIQNFVIEIKDNHIWHKRELESGKWNSKEESAKQYSKLNNKKFFLLFKDDLKKFKELLRYSLDLHESVRS
jgi:hypothetical protein